MKIITLALLFICPCSFADEVVKIVTEQSSYSYIEGGQVAGPATKVLSEIAKRAGIKNTIFALYPWARSYSLAISVPDVIIYPIVRTPEREKLFHWVGILTSTPTILYKLRGRHDITASTLDQAKKYAISVIRDDSRARYLEDHGFRKLVVAADNEEAFRIFIMEKTQLIPLPEKDARSFCRAHQLSFEQIEPVYTLNGLSQDVYVAISRGTTSAVVSRVTTAFNDILNDGTLRELMGDDNGL